MNEPPVTLGFRFDWKVTLLVVLLLPVTLSLGQWQLRRADEKSALLAEREVRQAMPAVPLAQLPRDASQLRYRHVALQGRFDAAHCFLLDNQVHLGRVGYEIICPFMDQADAASPLQVVFVSRGFVPAPALRSELPPIPEVAEPVRLWGEVYIPAGEQMLLGDDVQAGDGWPRVVQSAAVGRLRALLGPLPADAPVFPWLVRLGADSPALLEPHWQVVNQSPEKHTGYAVQWFAMAATLVLIGIVANTTLMQWLKQRK